MNPIIKIAKWLWRISNRSRIPPLPRMFSSHYDHIDRDSERIMSRYGIRSPSGIKRAMKKYRVETVSELIALLEHHQARREMRKKVELGMSRVLGGTKERPHRGEIRKLVQPKKFTEIHERLKRVRKEF
jgi:hypothetical protein